MGGQQFGDATTHIDTRAMSRVLAFDAERGIVEVEAGAIGGYGLDGPIGSVRLRLARRRKLQRVVEVRDVDRLADAFEQRIADGFEYGDFQFATAASDDGFLRRGVFSCYRPVAADTPIPPGQVRLSGDAWSRLAYLAHTDPARAFGEYAGHYARTDGQIYTSDDHQLSYYDDGYHVALSRALGQPHGASEMITAGRAAIRWRRPTRG